jgi:hypothetical protein
MSQPVKKDNKPGTILNIVTPYPPNNYLQFSRDRQVEIEGVMISAANDEEYVDGLRRICSGHAVSSDREQVQACPVKVKHITALLKRLNRAIFVFQYPEDAVNVGIILRSTSHSHRILLTPDASAERDFTEGRVSVIAVLNSVMGELKSISAATDIIYLSLPVSIQGYNLSRSRVSPDAVAYHFLCKGTIDIDISEALAKDEDYVPSVERLKNT